MKNHFLALALLLPSIASLAQDYKPEALPETINPEETINCSPVISIDGQALYFFSNRDGSDQIWVANQLGDTWGTAEKLPESINGKGEARCLCFSPDGTELYFSFNDREGMFKTRRINENVWSEPEEVTFENFTINDASMSITTDGQTALISQSYAIYVAKRKSDNLWTEPILVEALETSSMESCPFIAADNKTIYFSSDGMGGYGNNDLFVSRRLDDSWQKWSEPENMGEHINSARFENFFVIDAKGENAYTYKYDGTSGKIYNVKLKDSQRPENVVLVKGNLSDKLSGKPLFGTIVYSDLNTGKELGRISSMSGTGAYQLVLQPGIEYGFKAEVPNYFGVNAYLDLRKVEGYQEMTYNLQLVPIQKGEVVRMNNLFFETNSATIKSTSFPELESLAQLLNDNPGIEIELRGHTDNSGSHDYNVSLSAKRAEAVKGFLVKKGIAASRLKTIGLAETKPEVPNTTAENKARNRRVEFVFLKI